MCVFYHVVVGLFTLFVCVCGLFKNLYILPMSTRYCCTPGTDFCVWCEIGVKMYFFSYG